MNKAYTYTDYETVIGNIRESLKRWAQCRSSESCDKLNFGFNLDDRFSGVKIPLSLDSYSGSDGSSSCSKIFSPGVDDLFVRAFLAVLNRQVGVLLEETASYLESDSAAERESEIAALEKRLSELRAPHAANNPCRSE